MFNDVFKPDMFTTTSLTAAIIKQPFQPGLLDALGIFSVSGMPTTSAAIEVMNGTLSLVPNSKRGAPGSTAAQDKRNGIQVAAAHLQRNDRLLADEVMGVRQFGTDSQLLTVEAKRDEKLAKMRRDLEFTLEYHRLGAIQGIVLDSDGTTTILNTFTAFGITQPTEVDFDLSNATPASGALEASCIGIRQSMDAALGGVPYTGITALCGDTFWTKFKQHPEFRASYQYTDAGPIREGLGNRSFYWGGINWVNYRGYGSVAIGATKAKFVAEGVPDLFLERYAPADYIDAVNSDGLEMYASAEPLPHNKGMSLEAQTNPLMICTRPEALLRAKATSAG